MIILSNQFIQPKKFDPKSTFQVVFYAFTSIQHDVFTLRRIPFFCCNIPENIIEIGISRFELSAKIHPFQYPDQK